MSGYDLLASHYDAVTGDSSTESAFVSEVIEHANRRAATLLEVACGTGNIIAQLADRYRVSGLDISPAMLAIAREKLPADTPLHLADMSSFQVGAKFDVIICVYHGINHLLGFASWKSFFTCARRHLNDGGVLIFDILTVDSLRVLAHRPAIVQKFGENYLIINVSTPSEVIFDWNIELLELQPDGKYESLTEVIRTASYSPDAICQALVKDFADVELIESDGGLVGDGDEDRIWFVCTTPAPLPNAGLRTDR
jgi:SAM-dependent methyltransferase